MADQPVTPSPEAASPPAKEAVRFSHIPDDIAKAMPDDTRDEFVRRETYIKDWEKNLSEARERAEAQLKAGGGKAEAQELYQDTVRSIGNVHSGTQGLDTQKSTLMREETDYTDMARRTFATADRNQMERPQVGWIGDSFNDDKNAAGGRDYGKDGKPGPDVNGVYNQGKPVVMFGAKLVDGLSPDARQFVADHEVGHTLPQNQSMMSANPKRAEYLADEFAMRQPGATVEAAKEALTRGDAAGDATHTSVEDRLKNIKREFDEHNKEQKSSSAVGSPPAGLPESALSSLRDISASLNAHAQQAKQADDVPTMAAAPAGISSTARGVA